MFTQKSELIHILLLGYIIVKHGKAKLAERVKKSPKDTCVNYKSNLLCDRYSVDLCVHCT